MSQEIQIQQADLGDLEKYRNLRLEALSTDPDVYLDDIVEAYEAEDSVWMRDLTDPSRVVLLGIDPLQPEKAVALQKINLTKDRRSLLHGLYVSSSYRSAGLAQKMVETAVQTAQEKWGSQTYYTEILHNNMRLMRLFERLGFVASGARVIGRDRYSRPFGEYVMTRTDLEV